jgi:hypothetical protein
VPLHLPSPGQVPWFSTKGVTSAAEAAEGEVPAGRDCALLWFGCAGEDSADATAIFVAEVFVDTLFSVVGRAVFLAFKYSPQALQMMDPVGLLLHKGVLDVPQLLYCFKSVSILSKEQKRCNLTRRAYLPANLTADFHCCRIS